MVGLGAGETSKKPAKYADTKLESLTVKQKWEILERDDWT